MTRQKRPSSVRNITEAQSCKDPPGDERRSLLTSLAPRLRLGADISTAPGNAAIAVIATNRQVARE